MAGMLPGVECARRRRFHPSGECSDLSSSPALGSSRRSSFCLYVSSHESVLGESFSLRSSVKNQANTDDCEDGKLGGAAREAKERLDGRLRAARKLVTKRGSESKEIRTRMARMSWKWRCWDQRRGERRRG
ncbi:uncharacterized protein LOC127793909 isoform X2 [Diospyros lotus]|uniref:uncharacterized protein LOC127793909 isoform X2 n=1 Tax=Diospyros lotus TaxID=55363 RepID=UPI0022575232|nr:uncharacterized protein LOC127793909 isoform X2 [Diospyros lotus]